MDSANLLIQQGHDLIHQQRFGEAIQAFGQAAQEAPCDKEPLVQLGLLCRDLDDAEGAMNFFKRAAALDAGDAHIRLNLGLVQYEVGLLEDAAEMLQDSVTIIDQGLQDARALIASNEVTSSVLMQDQIACLEAVAADTRELITIIAAEQAEVEAAAVADAAV